MRLTLSTLVLLLVASLAQAQSPATSYTVKFYAPGAPAATQTESFTASAAVCNQAPPVTTNTVNPTRFIWIDPANAGKVCIATETATGLLFSLPIGSYEATLSAVNLVGTSSESNRAPFSRDAVLPAPTSFAVVR